LLFLPCDWEVQIIKGVVFMEKKKKKKRKKKKEKKTFRFESVYNFNICLIDSYFYHLILIKLIFILYFILFLFLFFIFIFIFFPPPQSDLLLCGIPIISCGTRKSSLWSLISFKDRPGLDVDCQTKTG